MRREEAGGRAPQAPMQMGGRREVASRVSRQGGAQQGCLQHRPASQGVWPGACPQVFSNIRSGSPACGGRRDPNEEERRPPSVTASLITGRPGEAEAWQGGAARRPELLMKPLVTEVGSSRREARQEGERGGEGVPPTASASGGGVRDPGTPPGSPPRSPTGSECTTWPGEAAISELGCKEGS